MRQEWLPSKHLWCHRDGGNRWVSTIFLTGRYETDVYETMVFQGFRKCPATGELLRDIDCIDARWVSTLEAAAEMDRQMCVKYGCHKPGIMSLPKRYRVSRFNLRRKMRKDRKNPRKLVTVMRNLLAI